MCVRRGELLDSPKTSPHLMFKALVWNVRGIAKRPSRLRLKKLINLHNLSLVVLIEPKVSLERLPFLSNWLGFNGLCANVSNDIWVIWRVGCVCALIASDCQSITLTVSVGQSMVLCTFVHGSSSLILRRNLWSSLKLLHMSCSLPWLVAGDFNTILAASEKSGGNPPCLRALDDFSDMMFDCCLEDVGFVGNPFTWFNNRLDDRIYQRLDRVLTSHTWGARMGLTSVRHLCRTTSDHCPLLLEVGSKVVVGLSSFKFLNMWLGHEDFLRFFRSNWEVPLFPSPSSPLIGLWLKHKRLKIALKWWNKNVFGNVFALVQNAERDVAQAEIEFSASGSINDRANLNLLNARLLHALKLEEDFWFQKSGSQRILDGDRNTHYYHNLVKKKRACNVISSIKLDDNVTITDAHLIVDAGVEYFKSVLNNSKSSLRPIRPGVIPSLVTVADNTMLAALPTLDEIRQVVFAFPANKATGPDGFTSEFYQVGWPVIADDLCLAIQAFFLGEDIPKFFSSTVITLIPKIAGPVRWADFRPISLCTVFYKIISKILANRLVTLLPKLISPYQMAYVKDRNIADSILIAQELVGDLKANRKFCNLLVKLDISKAYDSIEWDFVSSVLRCFGFADNVIKCFSRCFSQNWFSIIINGFAHGFFQSSRGLRQGDPLSPLLFILATDYCSRALASCVRIHPGCSFKARNNCAPSHLAYADDFLIFTNSKPSSLRRLLKLWAHFENVSGLSINVNKCAWLGNKNLDLHCSGRICRWLGFGPASLPMSYLGVPLFTGHKKIVYFDELFSKFLAKIASWKLNFLSLGGRITLARSVLTSLPIYLMQVIDPPVAVVDRFSKCCNRFLWGSLSGSRRRHWASWEKLCFPVDEGGLGFRSFKDLLKVFAIKLWWRFRTGKSLWAGLLNTKYCLNCHPVTAGCPGFSSPVWKRLLEVRDLAEPDICWGVGLGNLSFWYDNWVGDSPFYRSVPNPAISNALVKDFWIGADWNALELAKLLPFVLVDEILAIPVGSLNVDAPFSRSSNSLFFSGKKIWHSIREIKPVNACRCFWSPVTPINVSAFIWRLFWNFIPVDTINQLGGLPLASKCQCCNEIESIFHTFFDSSAARAIWSWLGCAFGCRLPQIMSLMHLICLLSELDGGLDPCSPVFVISFYALWLIWKARNDAKFNNIRFSHNRIIKDISQFSSQLISAGVFEHKKLKLIRNLCMNINITMPTEFSLPKIGRWLLCDRNEIKLNTDGCSKGNPGPAGAGGLARDCFGNLVFAFAKPLGSQSSLYAEMCALLTGIEICVNLGFTNIWLECDSSLVVLLISKGSCKYASLFYMFKRAFALLDQCSFRISHIYREGNRAADCLANISLGLNSMVVWDKICFKEVLGWMRLDRWGFPFIRGSV